MATSEKKHNEKSSDKTDQAIILPSIDANIAERAYYKSESRGFQPGYEIDDWLEAEQEYLESIS